MRAFKGFFGSAWFAALILMGSIARGEEAGPAESASSTSASSMKEKELAELLPQFLKIYAKVFYSAPIPCGGNCTVPITLTWTTVGTKDYCIATAPEELSFAPGASGTITWKLDHTVLNGRNVEFHKDHGILFVADNDKQIKDLKRTNTDVFEAKNQHTKKSKATYLPVVIWWTAGADPQPELCAAGDPIINNK